MKKILALAFLMACGNQRVDVGGEVVVKHQIDLNLFRDYYTEYCENTVSTPEEVEDCVNLKMEELMDALIAGNVL